MDRNEYLEIVAAQIRCKRAVPYLKEELEDHIQDQKDAYIAEGMNPFEAEMDAVREMGDPVETGVQLDMVHKPKMEWKVFIGAIIFGIIGFILQVSIVVAVGNPNIYYEIMKQTGIFLGGLIIMTVICYVDYSILAKHARKLWIVLNVLLFMICVCEVPLLSQVVNGMNRSALFAVYFTFPVYAAFVYSYRNEGRKGLLICIASLGIFDWILGYGIPLGWIVKFTVINLFILGRALYKNWFGIQKEERKKIWKITLITVVSAIVITGAKMLYDWMNYGIFHLQGIPVYYVERLKMFLSGNAKDYIADNIQAFCQTGANEIEMPFLMEHIKSDYIWLFITEKWGWTTGLILSIAFVSFTVVLIHKTYHHKNQLGHFISLACTMFLVIEIFFYVGGNFGVTPFMTSIMPFLGDGKTVAVVTYFYMGILLSVFRNTNVVRN